MCVSLADYYVKNIPDRVLEISITVNNHTDGEVRLSVNLLIIVEQDHSFKALCKNSKGELINLIYNPHLLEFEVTNEIWQGELSLRSSYKKRVGDMVVALGPILFKQPFTFKRLIYGLDPYDEEAWVNWDFSDKCWKPVVSRPSLT